MQKDPFHEYWSAFLGMLSLQKPLHLSPRETFSLLLGSAILFLGAGGAFTLGVAVTLPKSVFGLMNSESIAHLTFQNSIIIICGIALYRVIMIFCVGIAVNLVFLWSKFIVGPKRPGGIHNPSVYRYQRRLTKRSISSPFFRKLTLGAQLLLMGGAFFYYFGAPESGSEPPVFSALVLGIAGSICLAGVAGTMSAHGVGKTQTRLQFYGTELGRGILVVALLMLFVFLGILRTNGLVWGPSILLKGPSGTCAISAVMPVFGGDLYFDKLSKSFIVISPSSNIFYAPTVAEMPEPACIDVAMSD